MSRSIPSVRLLLAFLALCAAVAAAIAGTVFIEHRIHGRGDDHHDHDHQDHHEPGKAEPDHAEHAPHRVRLTPAMRANAGLEILQAGPGKVAVTVSLPGEVALNAEAMAHVTPRVAGVVREVNKRLGDTVKKGDVLATLDSRELTEMQRELSAARERLTLAESSYTQQEALWREKLTPEKDYLASKHALAEARIQHRSAADKLSASSGIGSAARAGAYTLVAPLDGAIIDKHISVGEVLKDDTQAFVIADLSTVWVNITVYAKDLARVRVGQPVRVRAEGIERPAEGAITFIGQVVGEQTRSATARVVLEDPGNAWRPGLFVTADVAIDQTDAPVVIADEAVQTLDGSDVVFVEEGDAFEARPVKLARRGTSPGAAQPGLVVEVTRGISAGERYAARNSFLLKAELGKSEAAHEH